MIAELVEMSHIYISGCGSCSLVFCDLPRWRSKHVFFYVCVCGGRNCCMRLIMLRRCSEHTNEVFLCLSVVQESWPSQGCYSSQRECLRTFYLFWTGMRTDPLWQALFKCLLDFIFLKHLRKTCAGAFHLLDILQAPRNVPKIING